MISAPSCERSFFAVWKQPSADWASCFKQNSRQWQYFYFLWDHLPNSQIFQKSESRETFSKWEDLVVWKERQREQRVVSARQQKLFIKKCCKDRTAARLKQEKATHLSGVSSASRRSRANPVTATEARNLSHCSTFSTQVPSVGRDLGLCHG